MRVFLKGASWSIRTRVSSKSHTEAVLRTRNVMAFIPASRTMPKHNTVSSEIEEFLHSIEGTISTVIEYPFGIILEDIEVWKVPITAMTSSRKREREIDPPFKTKTVVQSTFVPMSEIARIDFLKP